MNTNQKHKNLVRKIRNIIKYYVNGLTQDELVAKFNTIPPELVQRAITYFRQNRPEVMREIMKDKEFYKGWFDV